jgi:1,4-dihydroxy-2-naphthoate octaprenyltransferase
LLFVGIVGLIFCLIAALAGLRLAKESNSPWPMIFVLGIGALVLAGIVYTYRPFEWRF